MFKGRISPDQEALLDHGKQIEIMVPEGMFILQRSADGWLHIIFLAEPEILGFSQRSLRQQGLA